VRSLDENGRIVVRATRIDAPLRLDGELAEAIYQQVPPLTDFIQTLPDEGAPATERTEAWIFFDSDLIYVAARCWDSSPPSQWIANEMRRDSPQIRQNENFAVLFDTFYDRRNGVLFQTNPLGARADAELTNEGNPNVDWNPVWTVRTGRFEGGWTVELAVPFKSLRYKSGSAERWGINLRRSIRHKNEWTYLSPLPASTGGADGSTSIFRVSAAATLEGLDLPGASRNIEIKPYAISRVSTDRTRVPVISRKLEGDAGVDLKYGVTANLTADFTLNTDFAQVEVDEQQINLTRFGLFFPEKRDFFLEGRGIMEFGRSGGNLGGGGTDVTPSLFYTRRIGLNANQVVPIEAGGRLTGKVGRYGVGALIIRAGDEPVSHTPPTSFMAIRVKRDIFRRSNVGAMFTNRSNSTVADGSNQAYGVDAAFSFFENVAFGGYLAQTKTPGLRGDDGSRQARFDYGADRYGARIEYLAVGSHFNPEVGFVRRSDFQRTFASARFSPRPRSLPSVRKFIWEASLEYLVNGAGQLETREQLARFGTQFENSDQLTLEGTVNYELLLRPFAIAPAVAIAPGGYPFRDAQISYLFGTQRRVSGTASVRHGTFYNGTITTFGYSGARASITPRLSIEPNVSWNHVDLPAGRFTARLVRARTDLALSPRMFAGALLQYSSNDHTLGSNLRFRWEYQPGSELFAVYTDEHDTLLTAAAHLRNRAFVVKINRLVRF
jgi:hypothetical protein